MMASSTLRAASTALLHHVQTWSHSCANSACGFDFALLGAVAVAVAVVAVAAAAAPPVPKNAPQPGCNLPLKRATLVLDPQQGCPTRLSRS